MRCLLAAVALVLSVIPMRCEAEPPSISAAYVHDSLSLSIHYDAPRSGKAEVAVEVLSPEGEVLGSASRAGEVAQGKAVWNPEVVLKQVLPLDEVIWQRVRFTLHYAGEARPDMTQVRSISTILRRPVLHILGQRSYIAGAEAAVRVVVSEGDDDQNATPQPATSGTVRIELQRQEREPLLLFGGHLNSRGTADASFRLPEGLVGSFSLHVVAETALGKVETTENVRVEDETSILLTSEKPIYQPSQTIHLRALALRRADRHAANERNLTFEVEDPRGNNVFRKATQTDAFGIASAEFTLADEVNLGAYHVRARMGDAEQDKNAAELTVNVHRYVLPRFRVTVEFETKDGKAKRDYRPGEHVTGTVRANYFFGKAVDHSAVAVKASAMDAELFEAATAEGRTDSDGVYRFELTLPRYFAGREANHGAAPVLVEATVKDAAEHAETRGEPITVSESPLLITAIPEGGKLARGMENEVYVLASYSDGTPVKADLRVRAGNDKQTNVTTDAAGTATVRVGAGEDTLHVDADDRRGSRASTAIHLETRDGEDQVLLRTSRAVYRPGDRMSISVLSTRQRGAAYIDLVRDGQTILTRDVDLDHGRVDLSLTVTPVMCGTLTLHAYVFGANSRAAGDQRLVFVQPAEELRVEATTDAASYLPGAEARVHFRVTNQHGDGVQAALGLEVVDQAVFALAEKQPGFAKVFFYLEQELMKPKYEIHSLSQTEIVEPVRDEAAEQHDRVARVLFAAAETVNPNALDAEAGRELPQAASPDYLARYRTVLADQVSRLLEALDKTTRRAKLEQELREAMADEERGTLDAWGTRLRIERMTWNNDMLIVRSAGPDRAFNTQDDLAVTIAMRTSSVNPPPGGGTINVKMEHDQGPDNGLAQMDGTVTDGTGAVIPKAQVRARSSEGGVVRETVTNERGEFSFAAIRPGRYQLTISAPGFESSSRSIAIGARDRAVMSAELRVGAATEQVTVDVTGRDIAVVNGLVDGRNFAMLEAPMAAPMAQMEKKKAIGGMLLKDEQNEPVAGAAGPEAHVRSYFPEALYINPEILTDGHGDASIEIPMADSITTWRMAMLASTRNGALGTGTAAIKVFQDFFVDLDLPLTLTQGDRVSIPVAVYNYAGRRGRVQLNLQRDDWFGLDDDSEKSIEVDTGQVGAAQFTIEAKRIGKFKLTLTGRMDGDSHREDAIVREIEVVPNGQMKEIVFNGKLDGSEKQTVRFPDGAIPDASKILVRLYPGPLSQVIEGMDGILRMPGGCFEQTSSSTYPNVLALDYMTQTKKLVPEVHAKAEGFIATGYQRLLTFEVAGGGFSWFGQAPANKILTAYGLMEFSDMARVYDVDPRLIERTRDWLVSQQQADGSWNPDTQFINEGATNRFNSDRLRITAYISWALESADYKGPALDKARNYVDSHMKENADAYTLAVLANFAVENNAKSQLAERALGMLKDAATEKGESAWWSAEETGVYGSGESAGVETTGLAVQALLKSGQYPELARKALAWIAARKSGDGNWGTTQATIMALRALLLASGKSGADAHGTVDVMLNGAKIETLSLTADNNDLLHQFVLRGISEHDANQVELRFSGDGGVAYQVDGRYFVPWPSAPVNEPLSIELKYDRTKLAQNDIVSATATIHNNTQRTAKMVMVDLGIPAGFELLSEDLQTMVDKTANSGSGKLEKFSMTATQAILYFDSIGERASFEVHFRLRAKYPIRATNFASRVYEYYDPAVQATAKPVRFEVVSH
ncbi:MAG TPA: MG2 domain-containing protein [Terracidiphilus sp.]|jgi:uncharacterized protein YfaS (alpha-2-macroglobulin family)